MRKTSLIAIVALGFVAACVEGQTAGQAGSRAADAAGDTAVPRAAANSPVPQGWVNTRATKDDWEEINFDFNSSILTDGFPTLLWLADFLRANPDYRVMVTGNTDYIGGTPYNERLALARATVVKDFLVKYGASPGQIAANGEGKRDPELPNNTQEHRWVNRRVVITVMDASGKKMSLEDLIAAKQKPQPAPVAQNQCCDEILKRLDTLTALLMEMKNGEQAAHDKLRKEIDDVRNQVAGLPSKEKVEEITRKEGDVTADKAAEQAFDKGVTNNKKFSLLGLNIGPAFGPGNSGVTVTGRGQFFSPFGNGELPGALGTHAVQAQGEYLYVPGQQEGQFDLGLVNRWDRLQMGMFSSFKYVNISQYQSGGFLGEAALVVDYLFGHGRIGLFGTQGFHNEAVVNSVPLGPTSFTETYLRLVNQIGASGQIGLFGRTYLEGNFGYLESHAPGQAGRPGGTLRLVYPFSRQFALTAEVGLNETFLAAKNTGRVVLGFEFGNWMRPGDYLKTTQPVPMDIPRVRYQLLTRHAGNSAPVANAGPDQIGVQPGQKTLDGSASYDPDGDPLTYQWAEILGPSVAISGATSVKAGFTAASGQTYIFRLTVTDPGGLKSTAEVTIKTIKTNVQIVKFVAQPDTINAGQSSTLIWTVQNADTVQISGIGTVALNGTSVVAPTQTTTYTLTARRGSDQQNATVTVTVLGSGVQIVQFTASPTNISPGGTSTLAWTTQNTVQATITGIGNVSPNGSTQVSPPQTTTYTLTATGKDGTHVTSNVIVTVGNGQAPKIVNFVATPTQVAQGGQANLVWNVVNATTVNISGVGSVALTGTTPVKPATTTTYTLTASNAQGSVTATAVVAVTGTGPMCNAGPNQAIFSNSAQLNATGTFSPSGLPLTYLFSFVSGPATATITGANTATPRVTMPEYGTYIFELTATDTKGGSCTAYTQVRFEDP
jgi:outer membrane protein OmpA-like peptidoglycan-associated protein